MTWIHVVAAALMLAATLALLAFLRLAENADAVAATAEPGWSAHGLPEPPLPPALALITRAPRPAEVEVERPYRHAA